MILVRKSNDRGHTLNNWLKSFHTFSFGEYYDPQFIRFGTLRVINEDFVQAGKGFGTHPHNNMEIITYVVEGSLEHKDSMGTGSIIKPGEIQIMSAGSGIEHSEFNHSQKETLHLLQIWILPDQENLTPHYQQKTISKIFNQLILIAAKTSSDASVIIHQDVELYAAYLTSTSILSYPIKNDRLIWIQLIKGKIAVNENELVAGDGVGIKEEDVIKLQCLDDAELLLFDLG